MSTKINTAKAWGYLGPDKTLLHFADAKQGTAYFKNAIRVRIIRERDYRVLVKAANKNKE